MSSPHELPKSEASGTAETLAVISTPAGESNITAKDTLSELVTTKAEAAAVAKDGEEEVEPAEAPKAVEEGGRGEQQNAQLGSQSRNDGATPSTTGTAELPLNQMKDLVETTETLTIQIPPAPFNLSTPPEERKNISDPPAPPPKDKKFLATSKHPKSKVEEMDLDPEKEAMMRAEARDTEDNADVPPAKGEEQFDDQQSEIASIMEQFEDGMGGPGEAEIMSPRLEIAQPMFGSPTHPPRKSSLEPLRSGTPDSVRASQTFQSPPPRSSSLITSSPVASLKQQSISHEPFEHPLTPVTSKHLPPPPQPDPEPDLPFDFHRFLEQLRHRTADPVAKFLRSFLLEFAKKQWMVHEQVKIISDFLEFITKKMSQCEVWRTVSDAEFDNAREGMEKLVMNRLYTQTFSPAIPPLEPSLSKSKRRIGGPSSAAKVGRRGQHQEDVERDEVLAQKVRIYGWVKEEHLDITPIGDKGRKFMSLAQQGTYADTTAWLN